MDALAPPTLIASWESRPAGPLTDAHFVGGKAHGILGLPPAWVPPFVVLTDSFYRLWRQDRQAIHALTNLAPQERAMLDELFHRTGATACGENAAIVVRSNSPTETLAFRGAYKSYSSVATTAGVADAIDRVLSAAEGTPMCVILQTAIDPGWPGHMSNEPRVSQKRNLWLLEAPTDDRHGIEQQVIKAVTSPTVSPLLAANTSEVRNALRQVAGHLTTVDQKRFHCEWVWSGKRVWIVQADEAESTPCSHTASDYLSGVEPSQPPLRSPSSLRHFRDVESDRWRKLRRPKLFDKLGLPYADVFLVTGEQWTTRDLIDQSDLVRDLRELCRRPVVVRCDISADVPDDDTLLRTSPPLTEPAQLVAFMEDASSHFNRESRKAKDWAFLLAELVPARASAMVHARPRAQRLQVDTIWGFPDGLLHFPHDRWFYYPETGRTIEHRRYKSHCVLPGNSEWETHLLGPPFDWKPVLNEEEVAALATWALRIADELDREIQLMALARISGHRGDAACLPWHYTEWPVPKYKTAVRALPYASGIRVVTSPADFDSVQQSRPDLSMRGLLVRPTAETRRDSTFLQRVAAFAADQQTPIYFEGSLLGHAYYIMSRAGATVIPVVDDEPKDAARVYNKLVRDRIPVVIRQAGGLARVRTVGRSHAIALLSQKLIEEAFEVHNAGEKALADELADVLEVVEALRLQLGIDEPELRKIREEKRAKRGGFDQMVYLEQTAIDSLKRQADPQTRFPSFGDDGVLPARRHQPPSGPFRVVPNQTERDVLTLEALLIPPVNPAESCENIEILSQRLAASVEYIGNKIIVRVSRPKVRSNPNQRLLFPALDKEGIEHE